MLGYVGTSVRRLGCLHQAFIKVTYSTTRLCNPRPRYKLTLTVLQPTKEM